MVSNTIGCWCLACMLNVKVKRTLKLELNRLYYIYDIKPPPKPLWEPCNWFDAIDQISSDLIGPLHFGLLLCVCSMATATAVVVVVAFAKRYFSYFVWPPLFGEPTSLIDTKLGIRQTKFVCVTTMGPNLSPSLVRSWWPQRSSLMVGGRSQVSDVDVWMRAPPLASFSLSLWLNPLSSYQSICPLIYCWWCPMQQQQLPTSEMDAFECKFSSTRQRDSGNGSSNSGTVRKFFLLLLLNFGISVYFWQLNGR